MEPTAALNSAERDPDKLNPEKLENIRQMLAQGALDAAEKALAEAPEHSVVFQLRGDLALRQQRRDEARLAYEQALSLNPSAADIHSQLGRLFLEDSLLESALIHFEAARAYAPEAIHPSLDLIELSLLMGERQQALIYLQDLMPRIQAEPEFTARTFALLGQTLWLFGRWPEARAALLQALEVDLRCEDAALALLRLTLRRDDQAELQRTLSLFERLPLSDQATQLYSEGCSAWAQGDLPQARYFWRTAAEQGSLAALLQLTLAGPLVSQSIEERQNWQCLTLEAAQLLELKSWVAGMTLEAPRLPYHPENGEALLACLGQALHKIVPELPDPSSVVTGRVGLICSDLNHPERLDWIVGLLSQSQSEQIDWQVLYLQPGELPHALQAWAESCFQVPDHGEALCSLIQGFELETLIYLDLDFCLYHTALRRPIKRQLLAPTWPEDPGLPQLTCLPDWALLVQAREPVLASRADWSLPRLGHLYLCPTDPRDWLPEWDANLKELLDRDRKAFVLGLIKPGTALHTRVMQRHSQTLGDRAHRVRWLEVSPERLPDLISIVDLVIEPWEASAPWAIYQALSQAVPVVVCTGQSRRSRLSLNWLKQLGLADLASPAGEQAARACEWVTDRSRRAMLKERLQYARARLLSQTSVVAALEAGLMQELQFAVPSDSTDPTNKE